MSRPGSGRVRVRRMPKRADYGRETIDAILDEALVSHVGLVEGDQPVVIPMLHARVGDELYMHGASSSRLVRALGAGAPVCVTATLVDGLVLARSAFHHSVNYRSVVVLGSARTVEPEVERARALEAFTERLLPGRWADIRPPSDKELRATRVLAVSLDEASAKVRTGPPLDEEEDYDLPVWAGTVPVRTVRDAPVPDPLLPEGVPAPSHLSTSRSAA